MVKQYNCLRCQKVFTDKSKYKRHMNRKFPCKEISNKNFSCVLCNENIKGEKYYIDHLKEDCIKSKKKTTKYSFKTKYFSKKVFNKNKDACDLFILENNEKKIIVGTTKNLYNIFKKNYNNEDYKLIYYFPIKDINELEKRLSFNLNQELDKEINEILEDLKEEIRLINEDCITDLYKPSVKINIKFECPLCNLPLKNVELLSSHLNEFHSRKTDIINIREEDIIIKNSSFINQLEDKNLQKKVIDMVKTSESVCTFCNKVFSNKYNLLRHQKKCNKKTMEKDVNILKKQNNDLKKEMYETHKLLKKMIKDNKPIINNTTNITQNNIQININDYGKEDISHISYDFVTKLIERMDGKSLIKYIEAVHFQNPKNSNLFIPNIHGNAILLKNGDKWSMTDKNKVLNGIIVTNFDRINDVYEQINASLPTIIKQKYINYSEIFEDSNIENEHRLTLKEKTEKMIINRQTNNIIINKKKVLEI